MKAGIWHQCGDRSQKMALELIQSGCGVGVIISPRDLALSNAIEYSKQYHNSDSHVLIDFQFYYPRFANRSLNSYPISPYRSRITSLSQTNDRELLALQNALRDSCIQINVDGIIAPAMVYEAGRNDIVQLNKRLFRASKEIGNELNLPVYATVVLGLSVTGSLTTLAPILSQATALNSDGWYFAFEFSPERIPSNEDAIKRYCHAALKLATTGKPVLHAFAGPLSIISLGVGANSVGIGHSQNLWKFTPQRWAPPSSEGGGGGDAPPRFFSTALWGTIIYPDEIAQLGTSMANQVYTPSTFARPQYTLPWDRWSANKHLLMSLCSGLTPILRQKSCGERAKMAIKLLQEANSIHGKIAASGITLRDGTSSYQRPWLDALRWALQNRDGDYQYLDLIF